MPWQLATLASGTTHQDLVGLGLGPPRLFSGLSDLPGGPYLTILSFPTKLISLSFQEFLFPLCRLLVSPQALALP